MLRCVSFVLCVAAFFAATAPATAATSEVVDGVRFTMTDEVITPPPHLYRRGFAAALHHFGRMPDCPSGIVWKRMTAVVLPPPEGPAVYFGDPERQRMAAQDCTIWSSMRMLRWKARKRVCTGIAHEVGHLLGLGHSAKGLMVPHSPRVTPACRA